MVARPEAGRQQCPSRGDGFVRGASRLVRTVLDEPAERRVLGEDLIAITRSFGRLSPVQSGRGRRCDGRVPGGLAGPPPGPAASTGSVSTASRRPSSWRLVVLAQLRRQRRHRRVKLIEAWSVATAASGIAASPSSLPSRGYDARPAAARRAARAATGFPARYRRSSACSSTWTSSEPERSSHAPMRSWRCLVRSTVSTSQPHRESRS